MAGAFFIRAKVADFYLHQLPDFRGKWAALRIAGPVFDGALVRSRYEGVLLGLDTRDRINLDLALALAPPAALRYVLVHELCHLKVRNHSPKFWHWVESILPEHKEQRTWLRAHGSALKAQLDRLIADVAD